MSLQVFLQAQLLGEPHFLAQPDSSSAFLGRCAWLNLYCEVLPRALLVELGLSRMLLGSSTAEQFLLVLAEEDVARAIELLNNANLDLARLSSNTLRLVWAVTENLGSWPVARKRLDDGLNAQVATGLSQVNENARAFEPFDTDESGEAGDYFARFADGLVSARKVGWSRETPAQLQWHGGAHSWPLADQPSAELDNIVFAGRIAQNDAGQPAGAEELAARAGGVSRWGILLSDVDHFDAELKAQGSVEENIHLSILFKEFFAGELSVLCTLPEFWRKVTVLYRGGNRFAVLGSWDALVELAREIQRLFARFVQDNLQASATTDGKTISMALALAPDVDSSLPAVYREAARRLAEAKIAAPGTFHLFGRTLEWKRIADAEELKSSLLSLVVKHGYSLAYIHDLASVYREAAGPAPAGSRRKGARVDKPWRTYMRLARVIPQSRGKEVNNLRNAVIASLIGKRTAALKLRPSGRVALEWARLAAGSAEAETQAQAAIRRHPTKEELRRT